MRQDAVRVLLIEDNDVEAALIRAHLSGAHRAPSRIDHVPRLQQGVDQLAAAPYDVVLLDLNLPDGRGLYNLHAVKAASPSTVVIILTNDEVDGLAVGAVADGAQDYLIKRHITPELLHRSIRYALARQESDALRRVSEERYALAVAGARDGIWDWDLERDEIYYSPRWRTMLGVGADAAATPGLWFDRVHADDRAGLDGALAAHLSGDSPHLEHECRLMTGDGQSMWTLCRGVAVRALTGRATRIAGSLTDISDRKAAEAMLVHEVLHDTLTGLPNRTLFLDRLDMALKQQRRDASRPFAVLFLDLDRFKAVNDSLGHGAGDELLIEFGKRLRMFLRPGDSVARLGGDEFAILLAGVGELGDVTRVVERIHDALSLKFVVANKEVDVTASIGVVLSRPHYERPGDLLRDADLAMYRTKSRKSGAYAVFDTPTHEVALQRLELESDLRSALTRNEFAVYYQPIVELDQMRVVGFEALLRWFHPIRGLIAPEEFIPLAEKCGVIGPLSWWVMRDACQQVRAWQDIDETFAELSIGVNVSSRLFSEPEFAARTRAILQQTRLDPRSLHLEITENALLRHESSTVRELTSLQAIGVKFQIDDFGTGYSSLSYLSVFNYDTIKIDRSFLSANGRTHRNHRVVDALIGLGRALGMDIIAEGVETQEQARLLLDLDCRLAQGFWFSKPLSSTSAQALLEREGELARRMSAPPGNGSEIWQNGRGEHT